MWIRRSGACSSRLGGILLLAMLTGCGRSGPDLAPVSGRVTLNSRPLEAADVIFQPGESKSPSYGRTDKDGRYVLAYKRGVLGAVVGPHTVQIAEVTEITMGPQRVPPRYNTQSELHVEVEPDTQNVFDFDLVTETK